MASSFSQAFPPAPTFTEKNAGDLRGKVKSAYSVFEEAPFESLPGFPCHWSSIWRRI